MIVPFLLAGRVLGRLGEHGVANVLGLETLRHGTNPISWLSIHIFGAMPAMGGSSFGGDYGLQYHAQNVNRFYFAREPRTRESAFKKWYYPRLLPLPYEFKSTLNLLKNVKIPIPIAAVVSAISTVIFPTIKFHFPREKVDRFYEDRTVSYGAACSTDRYVSPLNIGIVGSIWNSLTYKTPIRMFKNPMRVLTGIAQLSLCALIIYGALQLYPMLVAAHTTSFVASAIFAAI